MAKALWLMGWTGAQFAAGAHPERVLLECALASIRLRAAVAALEWTRRGNECLFHVPGAAGNAPDFSLLDAKFCFVTKFTFDAPLEAWLAACRAAKQSQCRLVIDVSDYPFVKAPAVQAFYREVLTASDAVVVNSERMRELMAPHAARGPVVIEDAILEATQEPRFAPAPRLGLLWFGHRTNLGYLDACIPGLAAFARERSCRLTVVTEGSPNVKQWVRNLRLRHGPALEARLVEWSVEATRAALLACDLVLIPSNPVDPLKSGASANRIAEALNAGRFPVASPLQSYLQFADAAWLGADLVAGVRWALANRDEVLERIRRGQVLVREKFAADRIGRQWGELFDNVTG